MTQIVSKSTFPLLSKRKQKLTSNVVLWNNINQYLNEKEKVLFNKFFLMNQKYNKVT